jgi:hypothetical protein
MVGATQVGLDAVDELRLRRWARQHYVSQDHRDQSWHPIVIDEMRRRDQEHHLELRSRLQCGIVPLAPHVREVPRIAVPAAGGNLLFRIDLAQPSLESGAE